jgi:hypothetical protein
MARDGVGSVDRLIPQRRKKLVLGQAGPARKTSGLAVIEAAHFLQANQVSVQLLNGMTDIVNFKALAWPQTLHPFVNVPSGHTQTAMYRWMHYVQPRRRAAQLTIQTDCDILQGLTWTAMSSF